MRAVARAFARNPVFANIVLVLIFLVGYAASRRIPRETFPDFETGKIRVTIVYPGADPTEIEEAISRKIETALDGLPGVKQLTTRSEEGFAMATVTVREEYETRQILDHVRNRIEAIDTFPIDAEKPIIVDVIRRDLVLLVALSGDMPERRLKRWAEDIKGDMQRLSGVSQVQIAGARDFEISVEVTEERLQALGLTLDAVGHAIRRSSLNLPAGTVRTEREEIRLRTLGRRYTGEQMKEIVVAARPNGDMITLDRIATIRDGFAEENFIATLDGSPTIFLLVSKTPQEDSIHISDAVKAFVTERSEALPDGTRMDVMYDMSEYLRARIDLLLRNGLAGLTLVFLLVWIFLDFRLSFWVGIGMPVSIAGGLAVMWATGQSINMVSLFALIMVLGLIVDDAIVVGEAIHRKRVEGLSAIGAAVEGLAEVGWPVFAGVATTLVAFLPLAFVSGVMGKFIAILPVVVIACLAVSLIECLLLFPAHMSHTSPSRDPRQPRTPFLRRLSRVRHAGRDGLSWFIHHIYAPTLEFAIACRYLTLAIALAAFMITGGILYSGILPFEMFPKMDGSIITATVELPSGTPLQVTHSTVERIEAGIRAVGERTKTASGEPLVEHVLALSGGALDSSRKYGPHIGSVQVVLLDSSKRGALSQKLMAEWEKEIGLIPGAQSLIFEDVEGSPVKRPVEVWFRGRDHDQLLGAADAFNERLRRYQGVYQVESSFRHGKTEIRFKLKPEARALGLTVADLASQLQARYHGHDAVRIQRGREDVRVKVRYTEAERRRLSGLQSVRIRTPLGSEVPLFSAGDATYASGYASILRVDGKRTVVTSAAVDTSIANAHAIMTELESDFFPELRERFPSVSIDPQGERREMHDSFGSLYVSFPLALVGIYVLIAAVFRSYTQPAVILVTVPLGIVGAVLGHMLMGLTLSMLSLFGMVALAGVAVNDAIVMIEAINENLAKGMPFHEAVREGGVRRFRAVTLTTLTTVGGLMPLILETDLQAQFLIPMAVSIAGGEAFGTFLTVLLVPVCFYILNDMRCAVSRRRSGDGLTREAVEPARQRRKPVVE